MSKGYDSLNPDLSNLFASLEQEHSLPSGLLKAVAYTESRYNPEAKSPVGAQGMFQFMPATAKQYNVNVADPVSSAQGAAKMYADLLKKNGGDLNKSLAGYNWGQGNLQKKGLDNAPEETRNYISKINNLMGNQTDQKKNSVNIPPEAIAAFNEYQGQQQMAQNNTNNDIQPEAIKAFKEYQATQQPVDQTQANNGIPPEAMQAFQEYQASTQPAPQPVQTPVQTQQNTEAFGVYSPQTKMNNQSANIAYNQNATPGLSIYQSMIDKANKGEDFTPIWSNLNDREKQYVGRLLQGAYQKDGQNTGTIQNLWQGLLNSGQKTNNSMEQIISYGKGNDQEFNNANEKIRRNKAINEINDAMDPSLARKIGEVGGDIAQFITGEGVVKAGMTAAQRAIPGLVVKGAGNVSRAADLAVQGGVASAVQNPVNPDSKNFIEDKLTQAATGAVLAPVVGLPAEKLIGAVAGKATKFKEASNKDYSPEDLAAIQRFESQGIKNWTPADLPSANPELVAKAQKATLNDKNVKSYVNEQQDQLTKAVKDFDESLPKANADNIMKETGLDKVLSDAKSPYYNKAKEIEEKIANVSPDNPNEILKVGAEAAHISRKAQSNQLYKAAEELAPTTGNVELKSANKVLDEAKQHLDSLSTPSQINAFKSVVNDLESTVKKAESGKSAHSDITKYIQELGDNARQAKATGDLQANRFYSNFRSALNNDIDNFIDTLPVNSQSQAYKDAFKAATSFNRENIQKVKINNLTSIFESENAKGAQNVSDKIIEKWVKNGETSKVQTLFDSLPQTSKDAVQNGVMKKIINGSLDSDGNIIPNKLLSSYKSYQDKTSGQTPLSVILTPNAKETLDNLIRSTGQLKNIGYNKSNPVNGYQNGESLKALQTIGTLAALKSGNIIAAIKPIATFLQSKALAKGLTDPKFKKMLTNLNSINSSKPAYAEKYAEIVAYLTNNYVQEQKGK